MEKFYTPKEISEMLGVHLQTVRNWYQTGELDCYKIGRIRISESQLKSFLDKRKAETVKESGYNSET